MKVKRKQKRPYIVLFKNSLVNSFTRYTHIYAFVGMIIYLALFQSKFLFGGDSWAESFYEYVQGALTGGWQTFFTLGIAGYFNFLPKLFSYSYILLGAPIEHVDYFFRAIVILYTVACISFIAHGYNRFLIKNDCIRVLFAFATLLILYHVSSFSFINVWYVGFIPIILISLSPKRFEYEWQQILYAAFAMSVCFTKPSLILIPLIIYRMLRHKEYLLGAIILFSAGLQSLLFFTSTYYETAIQTYTEHIPLYKKIGNAILYPGLLTLKLYQLPPVQLVSVIGVTGLLGLLFAALVKIRGIVQALLIALTLGLLSYTAIYPPDAAPFSVVSSFNGLFSDEMKLQREVLVTFIIVLSLFTAGSYVFEKSRGRQSRLIKGSIVTFLLLLTILSFRTIDTQSSKLHVNIDPFRASIGKNSAICMPIPPTTSWYPKNTAVYGWYYESYGIGTCGKTNYDKQIDYASFGKRKIGPGRDIIVVNEHKHEIKSILLPIYTPNPDRATNVSLKNARTGKAYMAPIESKSNGDHLTFVAFNLDGEGTEDTYKYRLAEPATNSSKLSTGLFSDGRVAHYSYFLPPGLKHPNDK